MTTRRSRKRRSESVPLLYKHRVSLAGVHDAAAKAATKLMGR